MLYVKVLVLMVTLSLPWRLAWVQVTILVVMLAAELLFKWLNAPED